MLIEELSTLDANPLTISDRGPAPRGTLSGLLRCGWGVLLGWCLTLQVLSFAMCQECNDISIEKPANGENAVDKNGEIRGSATRSGDRFLWIFANQSADWWPLGLGPAVISEKEGTFKVSYTQLPDRMHGETFDIVPVVVDKETNTKLEKCVQDRSCVVKPFSLPPERTEKCEKKVTVYHKAADRQRERGKP
jgi:hypothetical protein